MPGMWAAAGPFTAKPVFAYGTEAVVWRWFDAVVLGPEDDRVRLWEPGHGEVVAAVPAADSSRTKSGRSSAQPRPPGTRAYAPAGLPGADWWVAGAVVAAAEDAGVELDEVEAFLHPARLLEPARVTNPNGDDDHAGRVDCDRRKRMAPRDATVGYLR